MFKFGEPPPLDWHECRIPKKSGGVRLLEIPSKELRQEQRRILQYCYVLRDAGLLQVSNVAHGFLPYRGVHTAILKHSLESPVFICLDVKDFFPNCPVDVCEDKMRYAGLSRACVEYMMKCCTWQGPTYTQRHFPQGSPTSPFLTNVIMFDVDCMIASYARKNGFLYTRYADDIQLSLLPGMQNTDRFNELTRCKDYTFVDIFYGIEAILKDHLGLELKHTKDHVIWRWSRCKPQMLGIVLRDDNKGYNAPKRRRRNVRAALHNLAWKVKENGDVAYKEDIQQWASIKGSIDNMDWIRSFSPDYNASSADPIIQTKFYNYLSEVIDGETLQPAVPDC